MSIGRRGFFKIAAIGAGAVAASTGRAASPAAAAEAEKAADMPGVLVDTTLCVGCRACEAACSEANRNPAPPEGDGVFAARRETTENAFTVVNKVEGVDNRYAKRQCMHCISPACASACPVRAMDKKPEGPVTYDPSNCLGCRYCMIACPFDIPKYEYNSNAPRVRKCTFCAERQAAGLKPACTEVCPSGALTFGRRGELLDVAKTRIYTNPDKYVHHVYGEHEAGGTSWLYIADVPLEKLALRSGTPEKEVPSLVAGALGAPPFVMTLWPPLLMGIYMFSKRRNGNGDAHHGAEKEESHG